MSDERALHHRLEGDIAAEYDKHSYHRLRRGTAAAALNLCL